MHFHLTSHQFFCSILNDYQNIKKGQVSWKFNNSLIENEKYVLKLRHCIQERLQFLNANTQFSDQMKWEYIKFEIRNFTKSF